MILRKFLSIFLIVAKILKPFLARIKEVSKSIPDDLFVTTATFLLDSPSCIVFLLKLISRQNYGVCISI